VEEGKQKARATREVKEYQELLGKSNEELKELKGKLKKSIRENVELGDQVEDQKQ